MAIELSMIAGEEEAQLLASYGVNAHVILMNWDHAWQDLLNIALYKHGADVSAAFIQIFKDIFSDPYASSDTILERHLGALSKRLEMTLSEYNHK